MRPIGCKATGVCSRTWVSKVTNPGNAPDSIAKSAIGCVQVLASQSDMSTSLEHPSTLR